MKLVRLELTQIEKHPDDNFLCSFKSCQHSALFEFVQLYKGTVGLLIYQSPLAINFKKLEKKRQQVFREAVSP